MKWDIFCGTKRGVFEGEEGMVSVTAVISPKESKNGDSIDSLAALIQAAQENGGSPSRG
jgi:hypothetical protein